MSVGEGGCFITSRYSHVIHFGVTVGSAPVESKLEKGCRPCSLLFYLLFWLPPWVQCMLCCWKVLCEGLSLDILILYFLNA